MNPEFISRGPLIEHESGQWLSNPIYLMASTAMFIIYIVEGYRKSIPLSQLMSGAAAFFLFFALGSRLPAFSFNDWYQLFTHGQWPRTDHKTILGGLAGLLAIIPLYACLNRNQHQLFNILALALPVGMGIQRISCLLSGCCAGLPTHMIWGIRYTKHSEVWNSQVASGQIASTDLCSLPVHPTQIYDLLAWAIIFFLAANFARRFHSPYARLILTILLYGCFRFFIEFLRDPVHDFIPVSFGGIKFIQWIIIAGIFLTVVALYALERWSVRTHDPENSAEEMFIKQLVFNMILVSLFLLSLRLLNIPELVIMTLLLTVLFIMQAIRAFRFAMDNYATIV